MMNMDLNDKKHEVTHEQLTDVIKSVADTLTDIRQREQVINVESLRVNVVKTVAMIVFAIATTTAVVSAYFSIQSNIDQLKAEIKVLQTDNKLIRRDFEARTQQRFRSTDAKSVVQQICYEIEKATGKKINCPEIRMTR